MYLRLRRDADADADASWRQHGPRGKPGWAGALHCLFSLSFELLQGGTFDRTERTDPPTGLGAEQGWMLTVDAGWESRRRYRSTVRLRG